MEPNRVTIETGEGTVTKAMQIGSKGDWLVRHLDNLAGSRDGNKQLHNLKEVVLLRPEKLNYNVKRSQNGRWIQRW